MLKYDCVTFSKNYMIKIAITILENEAIYKHCITTLSHLVSQLLNHFFYSNVQNSLVYVLKLRVVWFKESISFLLLYKAFRE